MSKQPNGWTDEQILLVKEHYGKASRQQMCEMIPARTWKAIKAMGCKFGLSTPRASSLTDAEKSLILEQYPTLGAAAIAKSIGRTEASVYHHAAALGIRIIRKPAVKDVQKKAEPKRKSGPKPKPRMGQTTITIREAPLRGEPIITADTKITIAPPFVDRRFVPDVVRSVVDSSQCREWAANA